MTRFRLLALSSASLSVFLISFFGGGLQAQNQPTGVTFNQIMVFGDSLSDTGNVLDRTDSLTAGFLNYPSQIFNYSDGRFTNSSDTIPSSTTYVGVWHEQLARTFLHIPPATFSLGGGNNFAFGAATSENGDRDVANVSTPFGDVAITIDNMGKQMDDYFAGHPIDLNALYIVWGGSNDLFNDDGAANVTATAGRIAALVRRLANAGARYIMVPNAPPLGAIPSSSEPGTVAALNAASANYRNELESHLTAALNGLAQQGITPTIYRVDVWKNMIRLLSNPGANGFTDTTSRCQDTPTGNPDHFLFWDGVHPTTAGHYWAAKGAYDALTIPSMTPAQTVNISTRAFVDSDERISIAGFIVTGNGPKKVLIRGIGPSLGANGLPTPLMDPTLTLLDEPGTALATNDNWRDAQAEEIIATGIPPQNDLESAIVASLTPGRYTVLLAGKNGTTGNGLVEVYDLEPGTNSTLANLSTRGFAGVGDNAMIGGIIISAGDDAATVLRAIGPSLASSGVAAPLLDPIIELHDGSGNLIGLNDNWRETQLQAVQATLLAPSDDRESAIVAFLAPGNYTAIVRGTGSASGIALVEAYRVP